MNMQERLELAQWVVGQAGKQGADQAAAVVSNARGVEVEYRNRKLDKLKESTQNSLSLEIYAEKRYSAHSTNDLRKDSLATFIEGAVKATKYLTQDEFRSLPDPRYYPGATAPELRIQDQGYESLDTPSRLKMAAAIEDAALTGGDAIVSVSAGFSDRRRELVRVHSNGFVGNMVATAFSAGASVTVKGENGARPEDGEYATTRFYKDLPRPEVLGRRATERALKKVGEKKIASGKYTTLVENRAGYRLVDVLLGAMTASALQQKRSFLDGMLGKQVASEKLTIIDDPFIEAGLGSRFFDNEGLAARKRIMIESGVLREYYVDNYYGKKLGLEPTTGSDSNLTFTYGNRPLEAMIKDVQRGIFVNGFIGGNSNSTTGDFSFGVVGALIENGALTQPLHEMNISGNAREVWGRLVEMGNDPFLYSNWRTPAMRFDGISFSGV